MSWNCEPIAFVAAVTVSGTLARLLHADVIQQWFPTCLGLRHPAEVNYILRHPVANP